MADVDWFSGEGGGDGGGGKSGKKNQKRRAKAKKSKNESSVSSQAPQVDPIEELRQRLADAKINKDQKLAGKLRQQLWIVQDLTAGVKPQVDPEDRDGQAMVKEFERTGIISLPSNNAASPESKVEEEVPQSGPVFFTPVAGGAVIEDKRLKNLNKKLKQIETLKEKQRKGEKLESNQLEKIKSEAAVHQEIQEIEELISKLSAQIKS
ncbi:eukaryotic translation initiation factor 2A-like [Lytechinus variegatus]|uniref:eukaryotic translation initiation factor 2A-like n=1 Tax=Lytechinus variegatus TaxID=7654 RepID=UPI001BB2A9D5|nr:eukaryotic translation initiation factor 2A-like [Lytechinus variegatus]